WTAASLAGDQFMSVAYSDLPKGRSPSLDAATNALGAKYGEISSASAIERHGLAGREITLRTAEGFVFRWRLFVAGTRLHQVFYPGNPGWEKGVDVEASLESFRPTRQARRAPATRPGGAPQ